jgi:beta-glucanase (GH16 family)
MNSSNYGGLFRPLVLIAMLLVGFGNCADDSKEPSPVIVPNPDPKQDLNPEETVTIPDVAPVVCDFEIEEDSLTAKGWTKVFDENFDADLSKWNVWTGGAFNNELQYYQAANLSLQDGALLITAKKETVTGATNPFESTQKTFAYTSGRIESKTTVSANAATPRVRIMARIKLPSGYGMWPAFWSYGDPWPTQGEIDILEARGQEHQQYQTNYFYGTSSGVNVVNNATGIIKASDDLTECYHVYELIWEQSMLITILDGTVMERKISGGHINSLFGKQERITLNLAVGGLFFSNLDPEQITPSVMYVDWVKVFTK